MISRITDIERPAAQASSADTLAVWTLKRAVSEVKSRAAQKPLEQLMEVLMEFRGNPR